MGNCTLGSSNCTKCNTGGCLKSQHSILVLDEMRYNDSTHIERITKIQSLFRGFKVRKKIKTQIKKSSVIDISHLKAYFELYDINQHPINLSPNIMQMEKAIGIFDVNEKETIQYSTKLKKYSIKYKDNSIYHGNLNESFQKEGYGILYSEDGCKYEGYFLKDNKHGPGRMLHNDGYYYEGYFENGKTNGFGKYVNLDGTMYIGYWKDEKQHGFGEEIFNDYSRYEGNYEHGNYNI